MYNPWGCKELDSTEKLSLHYSADNGLYSQVNGLPSGHIWLWELNCKEGRMPKNWCLWNMVLEKTRKSPLNSKEIKPVNLKWDQPWIFTWRVDAEAPIFWSSDANRWLTGKVPDAGKTEYRWKGGCQRVKWLDGITDAMNINSGELWKMMRDREAWVAEVHGVAKSKTQLGDWITTAIKALTKY